MKLFLYYAFHSIVNTFRKLFKTWMIIMLAAVLLGACVGLIAGSIAEKAEENNTEISTEVSEPEAIPGATLTERTGLTPNEMLELITAGIVVFMLSIGIASSSKSSNLFKPADVIMLFASPMKPQAVMMFRLANSLGMQLFISLYMLAQIPTLMNAGFGGFGALTIILAWAVLNVCSIIIQVTVYTVGAKLNLKLENISKILLAVLVVLGVAFYAFAKTQDGTYLQSAVAFFASKGTRWIPYYGWIRGWVVAAVEHNMLAWCIYLGLLVGFSTLLIYIIWHMNPDFYEEAIASCERISVAMEAAQQGKGAIVVREKERSSKIDRNGFNKGFGANVFFFKTLYNRKRFAILKVFTKTMIVYALVAVLVGKFASMFAFFALAVIAFYRTLGNPLEEDTQREFFTMIPEPALNKLLWSLFGGTANTLLDVIPAAVICTIFCKCSIWYTLMMLLFIISIDFFGTSVGAFIAISVPGEAGKSIKQIVQIMFIYFGIIPAAALIAIGFVMNKLTLFVLLAAIFDFLCAIIFIAMTPHFLENGNR